MWSRQAIFVWDTSIAIHLFKNTGFFSLQTELEFSFIKLSNMKFDDIIESMDMNCDYFPVLFIIVHRTETKSVENIFIIVKIINTIFLNE